MFALFWTRARWQIIYNIQNIVNLLPNLNLTELIKAFMVKTNDAHLVRAYALRGPACWPFKRAVHFRHTQARGARLGGEVPSGWMVEAFP